MKTYILKLSSGTTYKLYDGATLVSDTNLGTLFGSAGSAYFTFDFNSGTPSATTSISITNSSDTEVMGITGLADGTVKENYNFEGTWDGTATTFTSFTQLTGQAMDEAQLSFLMGKIKEAEPGKAKVLTSADYNYNPYGYTNDGIAFWLLPDGIYTNPGVEAIIYTDNGASKQAISVFIKVTEGSYSVMYYIAASSTHKWRYWVTNTATGVRYAYGEITPSIANNVTSTSTTYALSANMGKYLNDKINELAISGAGAPTTSTVGTVGKLYEDTTNGKLYICTAADTVTPSYTWTEVGAGGGGSGITELTSADYNYHSSGSTDNTVALWLLTDGVYKAADGVSVSSSKNQETSTGGMWVVAASGAGVIDVKNRKWGTPSANGSQNIFNVVTEGYISQSTGTSTTDIMSQNAVTKMLFPYYQNQGDAVIAIGSSANAGYRGSIALGPFSATSAIGEVNIGSSQTQYGYSSSKYRLLTGLYDGQSAHDAATVGQLSTAIINGGTTAPTTATVGAVGTLYSYVDTTGATPVHHLMACTVADTVTPSYTWVEAGVNVTSAESQLHDINNGDSLEQQLNNINEGE